MLRILACISLLISASFQACPINFRKDFGAFEWPLLFWNNTNELVYAPSNDGELLVPSGDNITIVCVEGTLTSNIELASNTTVATCTSDSTFLVDGEILNLNTIACHHEYLRFGKVEGSELACASDGELLTISIEVNLETQDYISPAEICFNKSSRIVLYAHFNLTKSILSKTNFIGGTLEPDPEIFDLNVNVSDLYDRGTQRKTINSQLGLSDYSTKYISDFLYTLQDHLFAPPDTFVYETIQLSLLRQINSAPSWRNGRPLGNWMTLLDDTFSYVDNKAVDLEVYSGTFGITTLPHEDTGEETPLYLYVSDTGEKFIPIPGVIWQVIYNAEERSAAGFVIVNNPFQVKPEDIICEDVSERLTWLTWDRYSVQDGFSYSCTYEELKSIISHIPDIDVQSLLV